MAELLLDVVQGHGLRQVDLALEAFLQTVPVLEDFQGQPGHAFGMFGPGAALAFGQRSQPGTIAWQRVFTVENAAVEAGQQNVFDQRIDTAHVAIQQAQFGQTRQLAAQELRRLRQLLHQQALQGAAMLELGFGGVEKRPSLTVPASSTSAG